MSTQPTILFTGVRIDFKNYTATIKPRQSGTGWVVRVWEDRADGPSAEVFEHPANRPENALRLLMAWWGAMTRVCPVCEDSACETKSLECGKGSAHPNADLIEGMTPAGARFTIQQNEPEAISESVAGWVLARGLPAILATNITIEESGDILAGSRRLSDAELVDFMRFALEHHS